MGASKRGRGSPERAGHGRRNTIGFGDAGQLDQPGPVSVLFTERGGHLDRQSGLTDPTGPDQCHQSAGANRLAELFDLALAADEAAQPLPQVAGCGRCRRCLELNGTGQGERRATQRAGESGDALRRARP